MAERHLGWFSIVRLGAVQLALGSIVVLMTSTLNRVMVIELALPSIVPGLLIGLHYAIQMLRPRWGYGSDVGGRLTPWIVGGMCSLALGGFGAAVSTAVFPSSFLLGLLLALVSFSAIGAGVGACGTSLLVLLAKQVAPERRAPAATIVWVMMISGFVLTAAVSGHYLDPFSIGRLIEVAGAVGLIGVGVTVLATFGLERPAHALAAPAERLSPVHEQTFMEALREVWREPQARVFAVFVFVSMLAYSAEEMIIEPFAGVVFALSPGQTTKLAAYQHGGVLVGMILVGILGHVFAKGRPDILRAWAMLGCLASAMIMLAIAAATATATDFPVRTAVFLLGAANGTFAVAAISSMMAMVAQGKERREGTRMGLWGAAQGIAFGLGGLISTASVDLLKAFAVPLPLTYAFVFTEIAAMFVFAAVLSRSISRGRSSITPPVAEAAALAGSAG